MNFDQVNRGTPAGCDPRAPALAYDEVPLRPFHLRVAIASTGGVFCDGYGLGVVGLALDLATHELDLSARWIGAIGAGSLAGLLFGALLTGPAADRIGRRPIFATNMLVLAGASLLQAAAHTGAQLLLLRLCIGFVLGTDYVVSKALLSEWSPVKFRGRILSVLSVAWAGGYACAYFAGFLLKGLGPDAWRWILISSAIPCLLVAPLRWRIPESPRWLLHRGRTERAREVVSAHLGPSVRLPDADPGVALNRSRWADLWGPQLYRRTVVGCVFYTSQVIPYFAMGTFVAKVISALHVKSAYGAGLLYNAALLTGAIIGTVAVDRLARRTFLVGSFSVAAAAMLALCAWPDPGAAVIVLLFALFAGTLSAASNLCYVYLPELFPTRLRASGAGLAISASRLGSAVGTYLLPIVLNDYGVRTALGACAAILLAGAGVCHAWAPETRNRPLDDPASR